MSVSLGNRRRDKTPASLAVQQHSSAPRSRTQQQQLAVRKQRSFIETGSGDFLAGAPASGRREYLRRDLSVGRSVEGGRPRAGFVSERRKFVSAADLQRQYSVDQTPAIARARKGPLKARYIGNISRIVGESESGVAGQRQPSDDRGIAWSSTTSLLRALDEELVEVNVARERKVANGKPTTGISPKSFSRGSIKLTAEDLRKSASDQVPEALAAKGDANRINLSIVLSQTIEATTENDADSASEGTEVVKESSATPNKVLNSAQNRRAQFHLSGGHTAPTPTSIGAATGEPAKLNPAANNFNVVPLTIQRRPPLVRAMSAPVRAMSTQDDNNNTNNKSMITANKRKIRRRKLMARSVCCGKDEEPPQTGKEGALVEYDPKGGGGAGKKVLTRSRSALASDVITLVSMVSSEGSDSERDEAELLTGSSTTSPARRAPLLRKSGKSVSFQENDLQNIQFSAREFPNIIRRGSIAPLAARIRANRPPTAPPVSIFYSESNNCVKGARTLAMEKGTGASTTDARDSTSVVSEKENEARNGKKSPVENEAPDYVRTIKERECWKLFQKMSTKGVNVTYDTILRGMLTPTEFRQLQKQRELEEAKARKAEEEATALNETKAPTPIERLSEVLLKK